MPREYNICGIADRRAAGGRPGAPRPKKGGSCEHHCMREAGPRHGDPDQGKARRIRHRRRRDQVGHEPLRRVRRRRGAEAQGETRRRRDHRVRGPRPRDGDDPHGARDGGRKGHPHRRPVPQRRRRLHDGLGTGRRHQGASLRHHLLRPAGHRRRRGPGRLGAGRHAGASLGHSRDEARDRRHRREGPEGHRGRNRDDRDEPSLRHHGAEGAQRAALRVPARHHEGQEETRRREKRGGHRRDRHRQGEGSQDRTASGKTSRKDPPGR